MTGIQKHGLQTKSQPTVSTKYHGNQLIHIYFPETDTLTATLQ